MNIMEAVIKEFERLSKSKGFAKCEAQIDRFLDTLETAKAAIQTGMNDLLFIGCF